MLQLETIGPRAVPSPLVDHDLRRQLARGPGLSSLLPIGWATVVLVVATDGVFWVDSVSSPPAFQFA